MHLFMFNIFNYITFFKVGIRKNMQFGNAKETTKTAKTKTEKKSIAVGETRRGNLFGSFYFFGKIYIYIYIHI